MYSQCPECLTRFRVTAAALRAAHGTVRCGRCGSAFDALPRLSDTIQDTGTDDGPASPMALGLPSDPGMTVATAAGLLATGEGGGIAEFHFSADDIQNVFIDAHDWQSRFGASASPGDRAGKLGDTSAAELDGLVDDGLGAGEATDAPAESNVWVHEPESIEDITLEGERIEIEGFVGFEEDFLEREIEKEIEEQHRAETTESQRELEPGDEFPANDDPLADDAVVIAGLEPLHDPDSTDQFENLSEETPAVVLAPAMPAAVAVAAAGLAAAGDTAASPPVAPRPAPWRRFPEPTTDAAVEHEHDAELGEELAAAARERRSAWVWAAGAFLLAVLLSAQVVHHYRLQLVRDTNIGPALREVYSRLNLPLPPPWNLAAFELRQWGVSDTVPNATGALSVRASIRNGARFAQPLPLLRLELEDRFGGTVARRDFEPDEYLKDAAQAERLLTAGAATEAELMIADNATEAVGYRLDVCMRDELGAVRCAQQAEQPATPGQPVR